jgi:hypothetical protein
MIDILVVNGQDAKIHSARGTTDIPLGDVTMPHHFKVLAIPLVITLFYSSPSVAQGRLPRGGNGIGVSEPKIYDNRTLSIMLEQLNEQLRTVQVVDQQKLLQALSFQQGAEASDVSRSIAIIGPSTPGVTTKETPNSQGTLVVSERNTTQAASTPTPPTLPELLAIPTYSPSFGSSAEDLLSDQISLSYQIFNVRMLLERSLSDRLWNGKPRLQAVVGFQVSLYPSREVSGHAARVEVTADLPDRQCAPANSEDNNVSLVAVMPYEKTYNSSALSNRASDFGGSAIARIITLGYHQRRRSQNFYLFRDADTIAILPTTQTAASSTSFGWEFRPVLGRKSVSPGLRNLFAVIALPNENSGNCFAKLKFTVRTYWQQYERRTLTTIDSDKFPRTPYPPVVRDVYTSEYFETALAPVVDTVDWSATDADTALVTVTGSNFYTGSRVVLGSRTYDSPTSGLTIKSERTMEIRTTLRELAFGDAALSGRYGGAQFINNCKQAACTSGILINSMSINPEPGREQLALVIDLQDREGNDLMLKKDEHRPLVTIGNTYVPGPYDLQLRANCDIRRGLNSVKGICWRLTATVPSSLFSKEAMVGVRFPFMGPKWADAQLYYPPDQVIKAVRFGGDPDVRLGITGRGFDNNWAVELDKVYRVGGNPPLEIHGSTLLTLQVNKDVLQKYKNLAVIPPSGGTPVILEIPSIDTPPPPPPKPVLKPDQPIPRIAKDSSTRVTFEGTSLKSVKTVWFENMALRSQLSEDGKLTVFLPRIVTKKLGPVDLMLEAQDGTIIPASILVVP